MVFGVPDEHAPGVAADLYAVTTAVAAVAGLPPAKVYLVFHCCAASKMSAQEAVRGSASPRTRSKTTVARRTSGRLSAVTSSTASMRSTSGCTVTRRELETAAQPRVRASAARYDLDRDPRTFRDLGQMAQLVVHDRGVPMSRCSTASSRTATTCGGRGRSMMACRSSLATTSSSARSASSPAAMNSARAYSLVWNRPGMISGCHILRACARASASSQLSNQLGIGPSCRRASVASPAHKPVRPV